MEAYQTERFDLTAGPAAAEGYPMEIVEGRFPASDGKSIPFGPEFLEGDWGLAHNGIVSGDGTAEVYIVSGQHPAAAIFAVLIP